MNTYYKLPQGLLSIIFILMFTSVYGQFKALKIPESFISPLENVDQSRTNEKPGVKLWKVFSDRENNKTFKSKEDNEGFKVIGFLESFNVIEVTSDKLHIVKVSEENVDPKTYEIKQFEDYGWIEKSKLLLWSEGLNSVNSGVKKKVMVLNSVEWAKKVELGDKTDILQFSKTPELTIKTDNNAQMFQIFYIYKFSDDKSSLLIGKTSRISDFRNPKFEIVGWAPKSRLIYWDHRIAIEPNWFPEAVAERKSKGIKCTIFRDKPAAEQFNQTGVFSEDGIVWDDDPYAERKVGDYRRFPFYDIDKNSNIIKNGVWGQPFTSQGQTVSMDVQAMIDRKISAMIEMKRNINIVFVMDGTKSMMPYFAPVARSVTASINRLSQTKNNIKFGVVVYRDLAEGEYLIERKKLTIEYDVVTDWLSKVYSEEKNLQDNDAAEAVFYGLKDALRNVNMPENETNYIVLIGDAGNHNRNDNSQVNREEIINLMAIKNLNLMAFQVNNNGGADYHAFSSQAKDLMLSSAFKIWKSNEAVYQLFGATSPPSLDNSVKLEPELKGSPIAGKLIQCDAGKSITPESLQNQLISFITKAESEMNYMVDALNAIKSGTVPDYKPALVNILAQSGISKDQLEILKRSRFQFFVTGYTAAQPKTLKYPLFQSIIFITRTELGEIVSDLSRLLQKKSGNEVRRHLQDTFKKLLEEHLGESGTNNLEGKSMEEVTKLLFGLPSLSSFLSGVNWISITDPSAFTDDMLTGWINEIEIKFKKLKSIQNENDYKFSFESNDEVYYWISQQNLP
ncbi:MAG: VWA domain-containing protein [Bacteroidales bacterium]|nr:VWA domain-containing protein [Bacteroidales bacterium]